MFALVRDSKLLVEGESQMSTNILIGLTNVPIVSRMANFKDRNPIREVDHHRGTAL